MSVFSLHVDIDVDVDVGCEAKTGSTIHEKVNSTLHLEKFILLIEI